MQDIYSGVIKARKMTNVVRLKVIFIFSVTVVNYKFDVLK
jgi:hypothetical protein